MEDERPLRILFAEDEPDIRQIVSLTIEYFGGHELRTCRNGKEAVEIARTFRPDLIILDVMMPEMDGPETLTALRQIPETAKTPIVFMTARIQPSEVEEYRAIGAINVIGKPFDPVRLPQIIGEIWENYRSGASLERRDDNEDGGPAELRR